jgi:hypothetical protein
MRKELKSHDSLIHGIHGYGRGEKPCPEPSRMQYWELRMTLEQFIKKNRRELDKAIQRKYPNVKKLNDDERRVWILTDKFFYIWAKSAGVKF